MPSWRCCARRAVTLIAEGRRGKAVLDRVTADLAEAIAGADVIVIPLPATSHEDVARRLAPVLTDKELCCSRRARWARS